MARSAFVWIAMGILLLRTEAELPECLAHDDLLNVTLTKTRRKSETVEGSACLPWRSHKDPQYHVAEEWEGNFCHFDPLDTMRAGGPWCFTSDSTWSFCYAECRHAAIECLPNDLFHPGHVLSHMYRLTFVADRWPATTYLGAKRTTLTGRPCQPWADVRSREDNSPLYAFFPGNLCYDDGRIVTSEATFFNDMGPWCVTTIDQANHKFTYERCYDLCHTDPTAPCLDEPVVDMMRRQFDFAAANTTQSSELRGMWARIYSYRNTTAAGEDCLAWPYVRNRIDPSPGSREFHLFNFNDNYCRLLPNISVPACYVTVGPADAIEPHPCHIRCAIETRSEFRNQLTLDDQICRIPEIIDDDEIIKEISTETAPLSSTGLSITGGLEDSTILTSLTATTSIEDSTVATISSRTELDQTSSQANIAADADMVLSAADVASMNPQNLSKDNLCSVHLGFKDDNFRCIRRRWIKTGGVLKEKLVTEKCVQNTSATPVELSCRKRGDRLLHYRGNKRTSAMGVECVKWAEVRGIAAQDRITAETFGRPLADEYNFCRNPTADPCGPFCYTDRTEGRKQYCFPVCKPEIHSGLDVPCLSRSYLLSTTFNWQSLVRPAQPLAGQQGCDAVQYGEAFSLGTTNVQESDQSCRRAFLAKGLLEKVPVCRVGGRSAPTAQPCLVACEDLRRTCIPEAKLLSFPYMGMKSQSVANLSCVRWDDVKRVAKVADIEGPLATFLHLNTSERDSLAARVQRDLIKYLVPLASHNFCLNIFDRLHSTDAIWQRYAGDQFQLLPSQLQGPWCFVQENPADSSWTPQPCFDSCEKLGQTTTETEFLRPCDCGFGPECTYVDEQMTTTTEEGDVDSTTPPPAIVAPADDLKVERPTFPPHQIALIAVASLMGIFTFVVVIISCFT